MAAVALVTLTGCGAASATPSSTPSAPTLSIHAAKTGYLRSAIHAAPGLTHKARLMHAGQDVCNDLGRGDSLARVGARYAMTAHQVDAVTHAAVGYLCPVYRVEAGTKSGFGATWLTGWLKFFLSAARSGTV